MPLNTPSVIAVIPARYQSSRFPGKPLANKTGKPLIQHVVERVRQAKRIDRVIVATDDQRIFNAVQRFGCEAVMTQENHPNGTSRIAEVIAGLPGDAFQPSGIVVNVQGDEPQIEPRVIDELVGGLLAESEEGAPMATLASPFSPGEDPHNPNIVKLVLRHTPQGRYRAMYFSRSVIPYHRSSHNTQGQTELFKHPGLYAYRRDFLIQYVTLPPTPLEQTEQLEQLRALEHGYPIAVIKTRVEHHGIDTPEQYEAFVASYTLSDSFVRGLNEPRP